MKQVLPKDPVRRLVRAIVIDLLLLGVCLVVFAYFHHVRVVDYQPSTLFVPTPAAPPASSPAASPADVAAPETDPNDPDAVTPPAAPEVVDTGLLGGRFAEVFTRGEVVATEDSYRSENVSVTVIKSVVGTEKHPITYYVADIYIKDITSFRSALALEYKEHNKSKTITTMSTLQLSQLTNSIVAIDGDNFILGPTGRIAVRNGAEWSKKLPLERDICVLYYDGTMQTYHKSITRAELNTIYEQNPYQIWTFGPRLLVDGEVPNLPYDAINPLAAIGYYEPGHYCFILVDGRQPGYSDGMALAQLAQLFYDLGCKVAYNLDGGDTAVLTFAGQMRSQPEKGRPRATGDILYIAEPVSADSGVPQP